MDREKAADLLDNLIGMVEDNHEADYDTALRMGMEALRAGDTIYRQAAIDALKSQLSDWNDDYNIPVRKSIENIERLSSAQPEDRKETVT